MAIDDRRLPSHYTGCEVYAGKVIAVHRGLYAIFNPDVPDGEMYQYVSGRYLTRADARKVIDDPFPAQQTI